MVGYMKRTSETFDVGHLCCVRSLLVSCVVQMIDEQERRDFSRNCAVFVDVLLSRHSSPGQRWEWSAKYGPFEPCAAGRPSGRGLKWRTDGPRWRAPLVPGERSTTLERTHFVSSSHYCRQSCQLMLFMFCSVHEALQRNSKSNS